MIGEGLSKKFWVRPETSPSKFLVEEIPQMNFERRKKLAGRKKEPLELIQAKGKKHLTKEEIKKLLTKELCLVEENVLVIDVTNTIVNAKSK